MEPIKDKFGIVKKPILQSNGTRILRPYEVKLMLKEILKDDHRAMFEFLLYTGCRYVEAKRIKENPLWFNGETIHLSKKAIKKHRIKFKERYIHLTEYPLYLIFQVSLYFSSYFSNANRI